MEGLEHEWLVFELGTQVLESIQGNQMHHCRGKFLLDMYTCSGQKAMIAALGKFSCSESRDITSAPRTNNTVVVPHFSFLLLPQNTNTKSFTHVGVRPSSL